MGSHDDVWAGGKEGQLLHWDGRSWSPVESGADEAIVAIWGASRDDVYAATNGDLLHYDGIAWHPARRGRTFGIEALAGTNDGLWATRGSFVSHEVGGVWKDETEARYQANLDAIWIAGDGEVFAVGGSGARVHGRAGAWSEEDDMGDQAHGAPTLHAVDGASARDVWAVGDWGVTFHWDGAAWTRIAIAGEPTLTGVRVFSPRDVVAIAADGALFRWDGRWTQLDGPIDGVGVIAFAGTPGELVAVGPGVLARRSGGRWITTWSDSPGVVATWREDDAIWTLTPHGRVERWTATSRRVETIPDAPLLWGLWGSAPDDLWAVGADGGVGAIYHRTRAGWSRLRVPHLPQLSAVWGSDRTHVWAAGVDAIWRYDGTAWAADRRVFPSGLLTSISGSGPDDVTVSGDERSYHWDGTQWSNARPSGYHLARGVVFLGKHPISFDGVTPATGTAIGGRGPDDVWIAGDRWLQHGDGASWAAIPLPMTDPARAVEKLPNGELWVFGRGGTVMRLAQPPLSNPPVRPALPAAPSFETTDMRGPFATPFDDLCAGRTCPQLDQVSRDVGNETILAEVHEVSDHDERLVYLSTFFDGGYYVSQPIHFDAMIHRRHGDEVTALDGVTVSAAAYSHQPWPVVTLEVRLSYGGSPAYSEWLVCGRSARGIPRCVGPLHSADGYAGLAPDGSLEMRSGFGDVSSLPLRF